MNRRKAFTIVECLVVVAMIAILAGMLIPAYKNHREAIARNVLQSAKQRFPSAMNTYHFTLQSTLLDAGYVVERGDDYIIAVIIPQKTDRFPTTVVVSVPVGGDCEIERSVVAGKKLFTITFPKESEVTLHPEESSQPAKKLELLHIPEESSQMVKDAERFVQESQAEDFLQSQEKKLLDTEVRLKLLEGATGWSQLFLGEVDGGFGFSVVVDTSGPFVPPVFVFQLSTCPEEVMSAGGFTFKVTKPELLSVTGTTVLWGNKSVPIVSVYGALDIQPLSKSLAEKEEEK